ncbi:TlpA family protein disulfide reductase [Labilibaculum antarcticum]|uniref:Thioredoxin domain-containing protein n=1 Tax=Labilibaculum antarcticum TaxID=1717717 RepID=A0A1Y1CM32_9BACT|nr:TlpA disulfide reductase family protein [Labilibaculum antarcticum]BAX81466.1 hypothetical protein ALGA_3166 [Labilibaculum antarcticum]
MKKIIPSILLIIFTLQLTAQNTEISSLLSGISLVQIKDKSTIDYDFIKETDKKIVIIEFWETWCAPCIEGMHHLKELKNKFPDKLEIICVSSDKFNQTTKFINKNLFPFKFIYDKEKQLSNIFPHTGIPHSIVVDTKGQIQAETYPSFITETIINKLSSGNSINIPRKNNFTEESFNKSFSDNNVKNSLVSFELQTYKLGDRNYTERDFRPNKRRVISGYSGDTYKDTLEIIQIYKSAGKNILQLYMDAYKGYTEKRFIFHKKLNYLKSVSPNNRYRIKFEVTNLFGDFNKLFINQLNASFALKTKIIEKEVNYYELADVKINNKTIMPVNKELLVNRQEFDQSFKNLKVSGVYSANSIASIIEDQIVHLQSNKYYNDENKRIYYPVITNSKGYYTLNISIENKSSSLDKWVDILEKNGLTLVKKKGKIKYIQIEKLSNE